MSDLEGTLTEGYSYWMKLNLELGISKEEDLDLYREFMQDFDYEKWMSRIFSIWKERNESNPEKLNKDFFIKFSKRYLKIKEGAKKFIEHLKSHFIFYVISGAPWEFCALAQEKLGFDDYFSTNKLIFDKNNQLKCIEAHQYGFHKEKILFKIAKSYGFEMKQIIAMGDSENDFTMLNAVGMGILLGKNIIFSSYKKILNPNIIRMKNLDFQEISKTIEQYHYSLI
ncbi:MAG: HAD family hydrolase [Promethearchaeota archaeon]